MEVIMGNRLSSWEKESECEWLNPFIASSYFVTHRGVLSWECAVKFVKNHICTYKFIKHVPGLIIIERELTITLL
jgi:hypothetical protein